jgi:hypothetical protein
MIVTERIFAGKRKFPSGKNSSFGRRIEVVD